MKINQATELQSEITDVTVFSDRAQVTRKAILDLEEGEHYLMFNSLPVSIEENSIQVSGKGPAILEDIKFQKEYFTEVPDEKIQTILKERVELTDKIREINDTLTRAKDEINFIKAIAANLTGGEQKTKNIELDPEKWMKMVDFYREKNTLLDEEIRNNEKILRDYQNELTKLNKQIKSFGENRSKTRNQVVTLVTMTQSAQLTLELTYIVYGANWTPVYDLRVSSETKEMTVHYNAIIKQFTDESWENVSIKLSTAQAQISGTPPEMSPWRIDFIYPMPALPASSDYKMRSVTSPKKKEFCKTAKRDDSDEFHILESEESWAEPEPEIQAPQTEVETNSTSVVFVINGTNTIINDNQNYKVSVLIEKFPAEFKYSSVPKLSPHAYLTAKVSNTTDYPFLSGTTNIFFDNNFVANSNLKLVTPGEKFETSLGVDDGIKVEHKFLKRYRKKEGVVSKRTVFIYEYLLVITNNKKTEEEIIVTDQLPLAQNAEITVKMIEPAYKEDTKTLQKKLYDYIEWTLTLKPTEKKKLNFKFSVDYPKDKDISGLI